MFCFVHIASYVCCLWFTVMLCVFKKFMFVHVVLCQFSLCCYNCPILFGLAFSIWIRVKAAIYYIEVSCNTFYTSKFWLDPQRRLSIVTALQRRQPRTPFGIVVWSKSCCTCFHFKKKQLYIFSVTGLILHVIFAIMNN